MDVNKEHRVSRIELGCCGAYCRTCRALADGPCRGCKLGYDNGERDLSKARCKMKRCCLDKLGTDYTCADCPEFDSCEELAEFYGKNGHKYRKYRQALEFVRQYGYEAFFRSADNWRGPCGKLIDQSSTAVTT